VEVQGDKGLGQHDVSWEMAKDRVALGQEGEDQEDQKDLRVLGHL
jgi:hypothetical protein